MDVEQLKVVEHLQDVEHPEDLEYFLLLSLKDIVSNI